jgi:hypothetical protein
MEYGRLKSYGIVTSAVLFVAAMLPRLGFSFAAHQSLALANFYAGLPSKQDPHSRVQSRLKPSGFFRAKKSSACLPSGGK